MKLQNSSLCIWIFSFSNTFSRNNTPLFPSCILFVPFSLSVDLFVCLCVCMCVCYSYMFSSDTIHLQRPSIIHSTIATLLTLFHTNKYCTCAKYWISRQQSVFIRILLLMMVCWSETPSRVWVSQPAGVTERWCSGEVNGNGKTA